MFPEHYVYNSYLPIGIGFVHAGFYAGGQYHLIKTDQFFSREAMHVHIALLVEKKDPIGHICETCGKVCRNIRALRFCSCWEPIPGMVSGRWG